MKSFRNIFLRLKFRKNIILAGNSYFLPSKETNLYLEESSKIIVHNGALTVGVSSHSQNYSSFTESNISMEAGSEIHVYGNCVFGPGTTIKVRKNGKLIIEGDNYFAHNTMIICDEKIVIGEGAIGSWGITLIDNDGHKFQNKKGKLFSSKVRPLIIGKNVGIQANVFIPSGVSIGDNAVLSTGSVIRGSVPLNSHAYTDLKLVIKSTRRMPSASSWS